MRRVLARNASIETRELAPAATAEQFGLFRLTAIPVEKAEVMQPEEGPEPEIFAEFREMLPDGIGLDGLDRFEFYDAVCGPDAALTIATGDQRLYANILLTIGVVAPE